MAYWAHKDTFIYDFKTITLLCVMQYTIWTIKINEKTLIIRLGQINNNIVIKL